MSNESREPLLSADMIEKDVAIRITNLHKHYPVFPSARNRLRYLMANIFGTRDKALEHAEVVRAINGLSLTIKRGERVGIIGRNGAGKSTLLKLLAGGFTPNKGSIEVNGKIFSLMPGNVSFSADLSAFENIKIYLSQFGFDDNTIRRKTAEIEDFVELGEYFHQPIKNYSLGMRVRTEFAAATCLDSEILVIDEVLGAGDTYWTAKCAVRMEQLCLQGHTLLFVSHALDQVMKFCERCIWIDQGDVIMEGSSFEVSRRYEGFLERLSWHTGDVDDKQAALDELVPNLGDVTLPTSGQEVVRWPGLGEVTFSGIWLNGLGVTECTLVQGDLLELRFELMPVITAYSSLRLLVNFWGSDGKRVATIENDNLDCHMVQGSPMPLSVRLDTAQIGTGVYKMSFSLFSLGTNKTSANEASTRQDVIYKSATLTLKARPEHQIRGNASHKFGMLFEINGPKGWRGNHKEADRQ